MADTNLCYSFRRLASNVWRDRQAAADLGVPWNEEPVTEWLLLQLAKRHKGTEFDIRAFTKPQETINGADWEFYFSDQSVGITIRIQAKRLYTNGRYDSLFKSGAAKFDQLDNLVQQAGDAIPLYVFYNHPRHFPYSGLNTRPDCGNPNFRAASYWGCSIAKPAFVRNIASNNPSKLIDGMQPWHCLVCRCPSCSKTRGPQPSLPYRVAETVSFLLVDIPETGIISRPMRLLSEKRPDWVDFLDNDDPETLPKRESYLKERNLAGVAMIRENKRKRYD